MTILALPLILIILSVAFVSALAFHKAHGTGKTLSRVLFFLIIVLGLVAFINGSKYHHAISFPSTDWRGYVPTPPMGKNSQYAEGNYSSSPNNSSPIWDKKLGRYIEEGSYSPGPNNSTFEPVAEIANNNPAQWPQNPQVSSLESFKEYPGGDDYRMSEPTYFFLNWFRLGLLTMAGLVLVGGLVLIIYMLFSSKTRAIGIGLLVAGPILLLLVAVGFYSFSEVPVPEAQIVSLTDHNVPGARIPLPPGYQTAEPPPPPPGYEVPQVPPIPDAPLLQPLQPAQQKLNSPNSKALVEAYESVINNYCKSLVQPLKMEIKDNLPEKVSTLKIDFQDLGQITVSGSSLLINSIGQAMAKAMVEKMKQKIQATGDAPLAKMPISKLPPDLHVAQNSPPPVQPAATDKPATIEKFPGATDKPATIEKSLATAKSQATIEKPLASDKSPTPIEKPVAATDKSPPPIEKPPAATEKPFAKESSVNKTSAGKTPSAEVAKDSAADRAARLDRQAAAPRGRLLSDERQHRSLYHPPGMRSENSRSIAIGT